MTHHMVYPSECSFFFFFQPWIYMYSPSVVSYMSAQIYYFYFPYLLA